MGGPGQVRIIAGRWRGRTLPVANRPGLRPTPDRVRETVFNWLMPMIEGSRCLDLFAGSGALGFEAASRGANEVWLIERDPVVVAQLRESVTRLAAADAIQVHANDSIAMLRHSPSQPFDLVFVDPPYAQGLIPEVVAALRESGWLSPTAWLYAEWPQQQPAPIAAAAWRSGRAGGIVYALYRDIAGVR